MSNDDSSTADRGSGLSEWLGAGAEAWVCPWDICSHEQAQACRAATGGGKTERGCGAVFPPDTTPDQARAQIAPKQ